MDVAARDGCGGMLLRMLQCQGGFRGCGGRCFPWTYVADSRLGMLFEDEAAQREGGREGCYSQMRL